MFDPQTQLLARYLEVCAVELGSDPANAAVWERARVALGETREPELAQVIERKDAPALRAIVEAWAGGKRPLPERDTEILRRALKAFQKSMKLTRLDSESSLGGGPMSGGRASGIVGIQPPSRFPREVWDELVRQGQLRGGRHGVYELPPG